MLILLGRCWGDLKMNRTPVGGLGLLCYFLPTVVLGTDSSLKASAPHAHCDFISLGC